MLELVNSSDAMINWQLICMISWHEPVKLEFKLTRCCVYARAEHFAHFRSFAFASQSTGHWIVNANRWIVNGMLIWQCQSCADSQQIVTKPLVWWPPNAKFDRSTLTETNERARRPREHYNWPWSSRIRQNSWPKSTNLLVWFAHNAICLIDEFERKDFDCKVRI